MGHFLQTLEATCRLSAMTGSLAALGEVILALRRETLLLAIGLSCTCYNILVFAILAAIPAYKHSVARQQHTMKLLLDIVAVALCGLTVAKYADFSSREAWMQNTFDPKMPGDPWRTIVAWTITGVGAAHVVLVLLAILEYRERVRDNTRLRLPRTNTL
ncbi:hypothetical protein K491DRAFT_722974 [Lophiostoma macrostomum CBS 122681]|uniref:Uncharacterized protein n=1 Tax=Lophiostoma macrostomum CBS 122681 TaxID=1314788 RepID=A0A6A6SJD4_9PLEO|nr:hypothetical protein K491DRAFT_722974 [Lophiostoma macrostomum CBS 122681]